MENFSKGKQGAKLNFRKGITFVSWALGIFIVGSIATNVFADSALDVEPLDHQYEVSRSILNNAGVNFCLDVASIADEKWEAYQLGKYTPRPGENPEDWKEKRNWDCKTVQVDIDFK